MRSLFGWHPSAGPHLPATARVTVLSMQARAASQQTGHRLLWRARMACMQDRSGAAACPVGSDPPRQQCHPCRAQASEQGSTARSVPRARRPLAAVAARPVPAAAPAAAIVAPGAPQLLPLALGQELELRCERLGTDGHGVCLYGPTRLVVLARGVLPGELLQARVTALHKGEEGFADQREDVVPARVRGLASTRQL